MSWITHISRSSVAGELYGITQDTNGVRKTLPVRQIARKISQETTKRFYVQVSSHSHEVADATRYLAGMGWSSLPSDGQSVHKFRLPNGEIWVPSQLLVHALFPLASPLAKNLFTPIPVTTFCRPVLESAENQVVLPEATRAIWSAYSAKHGNKQRLSWLAHSRSARVTWASVYRNALDGVLDCTMPAGDFQFRFGGALKGNVVYAVSADVYNVTCTDVFTRSCRESQRFDFARNPRARNIRPREIHAERTYFTPRNRGLG